MAVPSRSPDPHNRNVYRLIVLLLALSCLGFWVERRNETARLAQAQGFVSTDPTPLGVSGGRARGGGFDSPASGGASGGGFSGGGGSFGGGGASSSW
jgi:uncharacterized protein